MTVEARIAQGDFEGALGLLREENRGVSADPAKLLMSFSLEVRVHEFVAAEASLQRLAEAKPELGAVVQEFRACARAEQARVARLTDATLAGRRAALRPQVA